MSDVKDDNTNDQDVIQTAMEEGMELLKEGAADGDNYIDAAEIDEEELDEITKNRPKAEDLEAEADEKPKKGAEDGKETDEGEGGDTEVKSTETLDDVEADEEDKEKPDVLGSHEQDEDHEKFAGKITRKETKTRFNTILDQSKGRLEKVNQLTNDLETLREQDTQIQTEYKALHDGLFAGGLTPDELAATMPVLEAVKRMDVSALKAQMPAIQKMFNDIETITGSRIGNSDILSQFPDLLQMVNDADLPQAEAEELALKRLKENMVEEVTNNKNKEVEQQSLESQAASRIAQQTAMQSVKEQIAAFAASDPNWKTKQGIVQKRFTEAAQTQLTSGKIGFAGLPGLLIEVYREVSVKEPSTPKPTKDSDEVNTLRGKPRHAGPSKEIDINSEDWVGDAMKGMS